MTRARISPSSHELFICELHSLVCIFQLEVQEFFCGSNAELAGFLPELAVEADVVGGIGVSELIQVFSGEYLGLPDIRVILWLKASYNSQYGIIDRRIDVTILL